MGRLHHHVPQSQFFVQLAQEEHLNLRIGLLLGAEETGGKHLRVVEHEDIALVEIVYDAAEHDGAVGRLAVGILLEHVDGLTAAVYHHQAAFVAVVNLFYGAVVVLEHAVGRL